MQQTNNKKPDGESEKKTRKQIEKKLETALASLLPLLGEKKFKKRIKKAGKVLSHDLSGTLKTNSSKKKESSVHTDNIPV